MVAANDLLRMGSSLFVRGFPHQAKLRAGTESLLDTVFVSTVPLQSFRARARQNSNHPERSHRTFILLLQIALFFQLCMDNFVSRSLFYNCRLEEESGGCS